MEKKKNRFNINEIKQQWKEKSQSWVEIGDPYKDGKRSKGLDIYLGFSLMILELFIMGLFVILRLSVLFCVIIGIVMIIVDIILIVKSFKKKHRYFAFGIIIVFCIAFGIILVLVLGILLIIIIFGPTALLLNFV